MVGGNFLIQDLSPCIFSDFVLFTKATKAVGLDGLKKAIHQFCSTSGQQVNLNKSQLLTSHDMNLFAVDHLCQSLGVKKMDLQTLYLGLPLRFGNNRKSAYNFILDKLERKIPLQSR